MLQTANTYINGTAAKKLEYDVYEENPILKTRKKYKISAKFKAKLVVYTLMLFSLFLTIMIRYAVITKINYDINVENKVYTKLIDDNARKKVEIERSLDLRAVREIAETRLGMQMPQEYQIIYIKVPKTDFTQINESGAQAEKESGQVKSIKDKIGNILHLLG